MAKNETYEEYTKYYKRLKARERSMTKRGYTFKKSAIPKKVKHPRADSVEKIKKAIEDIYKNAYGYIDGKKVSGEEFRKYERSEAAKKGAETRRNRRPVTPPSIWDFIDQTVGNTIDYCEARGWDWTVNKLRSAYTENKLTAGYGQYLVRHQQEILECCEGIVAVYDSDVEFTAVRKAYILRLVSLLEGKIPDAEETRKMSDEMENSEEDVPPEFITY